MKRPLVIFAISLILGISASYLAESNVVFILVIILITLLLIEVRIKFKINLIIIGTVLCFFIGSIEFFCFDLSLSSKYKDITAGIDTVYGYIASEPDIKQNKVNYIINSHKFVHNGKTKNVSGNILLTVYKDKDIDFIEYGKEVEVTGTLALAQGRRNPSGFDYRRYLIKAGVSAVIYARSTSISVGKTSNANPLINLGISIKEKIVNIIDSSLPKEQAGLLNGMLIGVRSGLTNDIQDAFSDAGLTHIMAVSVIQSYRKLI